MIRFREEKFSKLLVLFLAFLFIFQGDFSFAQSTPHDPYRDAFLKAKGLFANEKFEDSKTLLEKLVTDLAPIEGRETFKGETYLLMGATYEKLKFKKLSIKYFCKAKNILGKGKTIDGVILKDYKYYKKKCPRAGVIAKPGYKKKSGIGKLFGTLLGLAVLGGLVWYLFINKNSPLKKKSEEDTQITWSEIVTKYKFTTFWKANLTITNCKSSSCTAKLSPDDWAPAPQQSNSWDDTKNVSVVTTGNYGSLTLKIEVEISGCNNGKRQDIIYVDGSEVLNVTNTFTNNCDSTSIENNKKVYNILQKNGTGSFTLRHVLNLNGNAVSDTVRVFSSTNND